MNNKIILPILTMLLTICMSQNSYACRPDQNLVNFAKGLENVYFDIRDNTPNFLDTKDREHMFTLFQNIIMDEYLSERGFKLIDTSSKTTQSIQNNQQSRTVTIDFQNETSKLLIQMIIQTTNGKLLNRDFDQDLATTLLYFTKITPNGSNSWVQNTLPISFLYNKKNKDQFLEDLSKNIRLQAEQNLLPVVAFSKGVHGFECSVTPP